MAKSVEQGADALVMDPADHVATALKDLKTGHSMTYRTDKEKKQLQLQQDIPFGHKVAIKSVQAGDCVKKYGEVIGRATKDIQVGEHVHVHNIEGIRGRGDQPDQSERAGGSQNETD